MLFRSPVSNLANEFEAGLVTITTVKVTDDLQIAKVYLSIYNSKISNEKFLKILDDKKGYLRSYVGSNLKLRYTPELRFFIDDTLDKMEHIQKLLDLAKDGSSTIKFE